MSRFERAAARLQRVANATAADTALYPSAFTLDGQTTVRRARIEAIDAPPSGAGDGIGYGAALGAPNNSHTAHLPPGVHVQPGARLTITSGPFAGARFEVTPPTERDTLGDRVGLSVLEGA